MSRVTRILHCCGLYNQKDQCKHKISSAAEIVNGNLEKITLVSDLAIATKQHLVQKLASLDTVLRQTEETAITEQHTNVDPLFERKEEIRHRIKAHLRT